MGVGEGGGLPREAELGAEARRGEARMKTSTDHNYSEEKAFKQKCSSLSLIPLVPSDISPSLSALDGSYFA